MNPLRAALEAVDGAVLDKEEFATIAAKIRGLLVGYDMRWCGQEFDIFDIERTLTAPLINPASGHSSRTYLLAGKLDKVLRDRLLQRVLMDHKTCSEDIEDPNSPYWRQLMIEAQPTTYMLLGHLNALKFDYAVWDVVRKPGIAPKQLTKADRLDIDRHGVYFGVPAQSADRETLPMYSARLAYDSVERTQRYFQRRTVARLDSQLLDQASEYWEHSQAMLEERKRDRHVKNGNACMNYGRPCKFLGVCSGYDEIDSANWKLKPVKHLELPPELQQQNELELMTVSRIKVFMTCKTKHHNEYEIGIDRVDAEEREALWFGTIWGIALDAWFNAKKEEQNGNSTTVSASGVESDAVACGH